MLIEKRNQSCCEIGIVVSAVNIDDGIVDRFCRFVELSCPLRSCSIEIVSSQDDEVFNRSKALNVGIRSLLKCCKVIITTDIDMLVPPGIVDYSHENAVGGNSDIWCISRNIPENEIDPVLWNEWLNLPLRGDPSGKRGMGRGSWNAMTVDRWIQTGGYDERLFGWGGEDDEFWHRMKRKGIPINSVVEFPLMHVNHPNRTVRRSRKNMIIANKATHNNWLLD